MGLILANERYGAAGSAAPLMIVHGLFGSGRNWAGIARRLAAAREVAAVDLRNHGESPWAPETGYRALGADLLATASALFERPPILLGHSMGGKAAMAAALCAPEAVAGLIIADIAPIAYGGREHAGYAAAMRAADLSTARRRGEIEPQLEAAMPDPSLRAFILANLVFEQTPEGRRARWRVNLEALEAGMAEITGWPEALDAARYGGASYFLHGGASDYVTEAGRARIATLFPGAEIDALPGAGHWLHAEQPEIFAARVEAWLARSGV